MEHESQAAQPIAETLLSVNLSEKQVQRFWRKVTPGGPNDCWNWNAYINKWGYGCLFMDGKPRLAHRIAYFITNGPFLNALKVCHSCDNPKCCNPAHLWVGTDADNVADRDAKGRLVNGKKYYGETHIHAKLTDQQVIEIRKLYGFGFLFHKDLAELYKVSRGTIQRIVVGTRWKHLL
jgi:hypothetical protein